MNKILVSAAILASFFACQPTGKNPQRAVSREEPFYSLRKSMIENQIVRRNVLDPEVIRAMEKIPRDLFVPEPQRAEAYEDRPLPIGYGQTISQPYIVALMTEALRIKKGEKVLEIGAGSGYQAAVLAEIGAETYTVEIVPELAKFARENLKKTGYGSVQVKAGDGYQGWKEFAPFDAVIVTCAPEKVPQPLIEQLKEGGRMIVPVGPENQVQELVLLKKVKGELLRQSIAPVRFVPMTGEVQKSK